MNVYIVFYRNQKAEIHAYSSYDAHRQALNMFKVRPNQRHMVSVLLSHTADEEVAVDTASL